MFGTVGDSNRLTIDRQSCARPRRRPTDVMWEPPATSGTRFAHASACVWNNYSCMRNRIEHMRRPCAHACPDAHPHACTRGHRKQPAPNTSDTRTCTHTVQRTQRATGATGFGKNRIIFVGGGSGRLRTAAANGGQSAKRLTPAATAGAHPECGSADIQGRTRDSRKDSDSGCVCASGFV